MNKKLTFITGNSSKAMQMSRYLGIPVEHHKLELAEIQSLDLTEVVEHKLREAYSIVKSPVLVDDVSLVISAMGRLPGTLIKYFELEIKYEGICDMVSHFTDKRARGEVGIGFYDGKEMKVCIGIIKGTISDKPRGNDGFGWDVLFIPDGYTQTRGEMNRAHYDKTNTRRFALTELEKYLKGRYNN